MFEQSCQRGHLSLNPETLTIENKPVMISGNQSKPPNGNIKTKLMNNSTPTTQEACGKASTTSQVLKGIKAVSSDGRDLAPGSPPTSGFRKTGNGEQYAFKKLNIEEYVKVIYMCQTCCQHVALCP